MYYYPSYSFGGQFGYLGYYDPWYYGGSTWGGWNRYGYGSWHSPYLYDPYGYSGGPWPYYWGPSGYARLSREDIGAERDTEPTEPMGSLRLRVSPRNAKVYVDGALAGIVDEFDGLTSHLRIPAGRHQLEFRLDGYETTAMEVTVEDGKTRTERASLKRR